MRHTLSLALVVAAACSGGAARPTETSSSATDRPAELRGKMDYASVLTRGRPVGDDEWAGWEQQQLSDADRIHRLVGDPFVASQVAPALLLKSYREQPSGYNYLQSYELRRAGEGEGGFYYLMAPCEPKDLREVKPWWAPSSTVRVCRDATADEVWETTLKTGRVLPCSAYLASPREDPTSTCGCGPNLLRCHPPELPPRSTDAVREEILGTIQWVVARDQPLARLFTTNRTFRRRDSELLYARSVAEATRAADPLPLFVRAHGFPAEGRVETRAELEPGEHAGVLTTPQFLRLTADLRQRMRITFEIMWCSSVSAPGAQPEDLLALKSPNLAEVSDDLASRPICTNCHARLDSAMEFFAAYPSPVWDSWHYLSGLGGRFEKGTLYARDIRDPRGQTALTPLAFATMATEQPEFARCMSQNVVEYVFGPRADDELIDRLAKGATSNRLTMNSLLESSLLEFVRCESCTPPTLRPQPEPFAAPSTTLEALVEEHCTGCHFDGAAIPSLEGGLDPQQRAQALSQVLAGRMPPDAELARDIRQTFLEVAAAPSQAARSYLWSHSEPPSALPLFVARESIHESIPPSSRRPLNAIENAFDGRDNTFTPTFSTLTAVELARACRRSARKQECLDRGLQRIWDMASEPDLDPKR